MPGSVVLGWAGALSHLLRRVDIQHAATINTFVYIWLEERENGAQALIFCVKFSEQSAVANIRMQGRLARFIHSRSRCSSTLQPVSFDVHTFDLCGHNRHLFKIV